jgi:hypothetical protein
MVDPGFSRSFLAYVLPCLDEVDHLRSLVLMSSSELGTYG